jgi:hypothetical protein
MGIRHLVFLGLDVRGRRVPDASYLDASSRQRPVPLLLFPEGTIFNAHTHR